MSASSSSSFPSGSGQASGKVSLQNRMTRLQPTTQTDPMSKIQNKIGHLRGQLKKDGVVLNKAIQSKAMTPHLEELKKIEDQFTERFNAFENLGPIGHEPLSENKQFRAFQQKQAQFESQGPMGFKSVSASTTQEGQEGKYEKAKRAYGISMPRATKMTAKASKPLSVKEVTAAGGMVADAESLPKGTKVVTAFNPDQQMQDLKQHVSSQIQPMFGEFRTMSEKMNSLGNIVPKMASLSREVPMMRLNVPNLSVCNANHEAFLEDRRQAKAFLQSSEQAKLKYGWRSGMSENFFSMSTASITGSIAKPTSNKFANADAYAISNPDPDFSNRIIIGGGFKSSIEGLSPYLFSVIPSSAASVAVDQKQAAPTMFTDFVQDPNWQEPMALAALLEQGESARVVSLCAGHRSGELYVLLHVLPMVTGGVSAPHKLLVARVGANGGLFPTDQWNSDVSAVKNVIPLQIAVLGSQLVVLYHNIDLDCSAIMLLDQTGDVLDQVSLGQDLEFRTLTVDVKSNTLFVCGTKHVNFVTGERSAVFYRFQVQNNLLETIGDLFVYNTSLARSSMGVRALCIPALGTFSEQVVLVCQLFDRRGTDTIGSVCVVIDADRQVLQEIVAGSASEESDELVEVNDAAWENGVPGQLRLVGVQRFLPNWREFGDGWTAKVDIRSAKVSAWNLPGPTSHTNILQSLSPNGMFVTGTLRTHEQKWCMEPFVASFSL